MKIYDTLIVGSGSGYFSIGYAAARPDTIICEEHQICDTGFYLPLKGFKYHPYTPQTHDGEVLLNIFNSMSLFVGGMQNTNGFEFAICKYVMKKDLDILLKCRVIDTQKTENGIYDVTIQTNEGLTHLFARKILSTRDSSLSKRFTVLFIDEDIESSKEKLLGAFEKSEIEPAFYKGRYALHIPVNGLDENSIKLLVYEKWKSLDINAKILYMAPIFYPDQPSNPLCDAYYDNPIKAFEAGYLYGKEADR